MRVADTGRTVWSVLRNEQNPVAIAEHQVLRRPIGETPGESGGLKLRSMVSEEVQGPGKSLPNPWVGPNVKATQPADPEKHPL